MGTLRDFCINITMTLLACNTSCSTYSFYGLLAFYVLILDAHAHQFLTEPAWLLFSLHVAYLCVVFYAVTSIVAVIINILMYIGPHPYLQLGLIGYLVWSSGLATHLSTTPVIRSIIHRLKPSYSSSISTIKTNALIAYSYKHIAISCYQPFADIHTHLAKNYWSARAMTVTQTASRSIIGSIFKFGMRWWLGSSEAPASKKTQYKQRPSSTGIIMAKSTLTNAQLEDVDDLDDLDDLEEELEDTLAVPAEQIEEAEKLDNRITGKDRVELTAEEKRAALRRSIAEKRTMRGHRGRTVKQSRSSLNQQVSDLMAVPGVDSMMQSAMEGDNLEKLLQAGGTKMGINASQIRQVIKTAGRKK